MQPEQLRRGKEFHDLVQADWLAVTVAGGKTHEEVPVDLNALPMRGNRVRSGRVDIFIDQVDDFVSVVEIKSTDWDAIKSKNIRKLVGSHRCKRHPKPAVICRILK